MIEPIKPSDIAEAKKATIPERVIEVVNHLIAKNWSGNRAVVYQDDIVGRLVRQGENKQAIFDNNWLDFEPIFEAAGWEVVYDKPAYNETYPASFTFSERTK